MPADVDILLERFAGAKSGRGTWDDHWERLAKIMLPRRSGFTSDQVEGQRRTEEIYDSTPQQARRSLATAIDGLLKPKTVQWAFVKPDDEELAEDEEVKDWTRFVEERMFKRIYDPAARFAQASGEVDDDLVTFGTGALSIDSNDRVLSFASQHLMNTYIVVDANGKVNGAFLLRKMTARQAEAFFAEMFDPTTLNKGIKPGTKASKALEDKKPETLVEYVNIILPRTDRIPGRLDAANMPFTSIWVEVSEKEMILNSGHFEFPMAIPRWDTASGETYGRSPAMIALPDANTLQAQGKTLLVGGQLAVLPPFFAPSNSIVGQAKLQSGKFTYYDIQQAVGQRVAQPIFPMQTGANMPIGREMQNDTRELVWAAFFKNVLNLPVNGPEMTATEIIERKEEFVRVVGPVFGRLEADYLAPIAERVFNIMMRNKEFGLAEDGLADVNGTPLRTIPQSLRGKTISFEFRSPVERVRKQIEAVAALKTVEEISGVAQATGDQSVLDLIDRDKVARKVDEANASDILHSEDEVQEIRETRAQQEAAERQAVDAERAIAAGAEVAQSVGALQ